MITSPSVGEMYQFIVEWSFCRFQAASLNIEENRVFLGELLQCKTGDFEIKHDSFFNGHHTNSPGLASRSPCVASIDLHRTQNHRIHYKNNNSSIAELQAEY